jgi:outer membrane protein assembly factor BamB
MTDDFTARLGVQLREAALREERRGPVLRALRTARPRPAAALGAFATAVAAGVVVVVAVLLGSPAPETATPTGPRVVANIPLGGGFNGGARAAFGSVWLSDSGRGAILRVDPRTRRVTARIPVGSEASLETGDGAVWAVPRGAGNVGGTLTRIDPRSGRVAAHIPLRTLKGDVFPGGGLVAGPLVWVIGPNGAVGVDPARNRVVREIRLGGSFLIVDAMVRDGQLWLTRADHTITRFDARTGRRLGAVRWRTDAFLLPFADKLIAMSRTSVALVDPDTGRALWRTRIGTSLELDELSGGRLFLQGSDGSAGGRDRVWELDVHDGRVIGKATVPEFSTVGMIRAGSGVWLLSSGGHVVVVAP